MAFLGLGKQTSARLRDGARISSRRHLSRNLRMSLLPIRAMRISRRGAATVESVSSSTKAPTSIPSRPRAMAPKLLQFARAPRKSRPQKAPNPLLAQATPNPLLPQAILGAPLPLTSPNKPHLSRPSLTSRCFASCIEAVMGGSCSSSIVRLAISLPSTHRSWCRERVFFGGSSCSGAIAASSCFTALRFSCIAPSENPALDRNRFDIKFPSSFINRVLDSSN